MKKIKKRLMVIDSNSVIYRAFHALPPLTTKKGELINAVYGFLLVFFKAIKEFQPDFIAACFDLPAPTFRHKKFKEYKAKRPPCPKELYQQIPKIKEILKIFNIPIFEKQEFEADDIIGTIAQLASKEQLKPGSEEDKYSSPSIGARGVETIILSGDSDVLQLINSQTKVYALRKGVKDTVLYDKKLVKEKYQGLSPLQLVDFKSLKGDPSDNIPGVPGVGEKTAVNLIKHFGSLENLYEGLQIQNHKPRPNSKLRVPSREKTEKSEVLRFSDKLKMKLLEGKTKAFLSKDLVRIRKDAPIDFNLENCYWRKYDKEKVVQALESLDFYRLIPRLSEIEHSFFAR